MEPALRQCSCWDCEFARGHMCCACVRVSAAPFNSKLLSSLDGYNWVLSDRDPYPYLVNYTDAAPDLFWRVERPQLLFGPGTNGTLGAPIALVNGGS